MINGKKTATGFTGIIFGLWLVLFCAANTGFAGTVSAFSPPDAGQAERFLDELWNDIDNDELSQGDSPDDFDAGQVEILMYELSDEDVPIMEFFVRGVPNKKYILMLPTSPFVNPMDGKDVWI